MRRSLPLALCLLLLSASLTFAQAVTSGTGAINGKVTDASDAVMPGVTVTITSPQQMGARTAVTDSDGTYRFTAVTPGDYVVSTSFKSSYYPHDAEGKLQVPATLPKHVLDELATMGHKLDIRNVRGVGSVKAIVIHPRTGVLMGGVSPTRDSYVMAY